jgi:predicted enzyme related to lactoylglutathione lyase
MKPLFENVDCVSFFVDDLEKGISFYSGALGQRLLWKTATSCGLGLENDVTEVVLVNQHNPTANFKVESVPAALETFREAGGTLEYGPFDIDIGKCAVLADPWGNRYCILDMSKGRYTVDENGDVTGVKPD